MADFNVFRGGPVFGTFDLARAYSDAERVKEMQQMRGIRDERMQMVRDEQVQAQQQQQELLSLQHGWAELKAAGTDPARRAAIAAKIKEKEPGLAALSDEEVLKRTEEFLRVRLGIKDDPIGTLYRTEKGFLPAEQAKGLMPYEDKPAPPSALDLERNRRERTRLRLDAATTKAELTEKKSLEADIKALTLNPNHPDAPVWKARYKARTGKDWDAEQRKGRDPWGDWGDDTGTAGGPLPAGIPPGSVKIGTTNNGANDVWQTPGGKRLVVE